MSKVFKGQSFLVLPLLLILLCNPLYAEGSLFGHGEEDVVLMVVVSGVSGKVTKLSSTNRLLGYSVTATVTAGIVGIYDDNGFITEGGCLVGDMRTVWFPMPKSIHVELIVMVNASTTIVTIYYE